MLFRYDTTGGMGVRSGDVETQTGSDAPGDQLGVGTDRSSGGAGHFTRDDTLEVLSNQRRRFVIHLLKRRDGDGSHVSVSELAETVAAWENDKPVEELDYRERKRVRNALRQFHLPKMAEYGFVEYDSDRGHARLTDAASDVEFYVDSLTGRDIPWSVYYLGLSLVGVAVVTGLWLEVSPFSEAGPIVCGVSFVAALVVSSLGHLYDNYYRMRLGAGERPSELGER
jgi:hypothetical protein